MARYTHEPLTVRDFLPRLERCGVPKFAAATCVLDPDRPDFAAVAARKPVVAVILRQSARNAVSPDQTSWKY